jgi:indolepyruvate ferredoxin oxidoreductase beta subunit
MTEFDLVIVGVGGQGAILASDIVGLAAVNSGLSVRASETHGMAQRGGSVENHVRIDCTYGSLIPIGRADAIVGLEPSEALRAIDYLSSEGVIIVNTDPILPVTALSGEYPEVETILAELRSRCKQLVAVDANSLAHKAGHPLTANTALIGALSNFLPLDTTILEKSIRSLVPPKTVDVNLKAFWLGREYTQKSN